MGCDWVSSAGSMIGYTVSYAYFFHSTPFAAIKQIYDDDMYAHYEDDEEDDEDTPIDLKLNPRKAVGECWTQFLTARHSALIDLQLCTFLGVNRIASTYETIVDSYFALVAFGYELEANDPVVESNRCVYKMSFQFPDNIEAVIEEFIAYFKEQHPLTAASKRPRTREPNNDLTENAIVFSFVR
jgi:hypothetical protein